MSSGQKSIRERIDEGLVIVIPDDPPLPRGLLLLLAAVLLSLAVYLSFFMKTWVPAGIGALLVVLTAWVSETRRATARAHVRIDAQGIHSLDKRGEGTTVSWDAIHEFDADNTYWSVGNVDERLELLDMPQPTSDSYHHHREVLDYLSELCGVDKPEFDADYKPPRPKAQLESLIRTYRALTWVFGISFLVLFRLYGPASLLEPQPLGEYAAVGCMLLGLVLFFLSGRVELELADHHRREVWDPQAASLFRWSGAVSSMEHRQAHKGKPPRAKLEPGTVLVYMDSSHELEINPLGGAMGAMLIMQSSIALTSDLSVAWKAGVSLFILLAALGLYASLRRAQRRLAPQLSAQIRIVDDEIEVVSEQGVKRFGLKRIGERRRIVMPSWPFGHWEEYGEPGHSIRIDRRYLRPLHESEDLIPVTTQIDNSAMDTIDSKDVKAGL